MDIKLDLFSTVALALVFFYLGAVIKKRVGVLNKFCIPTPVVGGILFSLLNLIFHQTGMLSLTMDGVFQNLCMVMFFTTIGYAANFKTILRAGRDVVVLTAITGVLICVQDIVGGYLAQAFGLSKLLGVCLGSIPLVGGHGNAGAYGPVVESMGVTGAATVAIAAATFGLVLGSLTGGPVADFLIRTRKISTPGGKKAAAEVEMEGEGSRQTMGVTEKEFISNTMLAIFHIFISMAIGAYLHKVIKSATGQTIPVFLCSMLIAVVIRNLAEYSGLFTAHEKEGNILCSISLSIFLALSMMSVKLWQLVGLALPMTVILLVQVVVTGIFVIFVTFPLMGRDYEAAAMCAAQMGYGLGATPNAMANIAAVEEKYGPAPQALLVIPFVGGLFTSIINAFLNTTFINLFK